MLVAGGDVGGGAGADVGVHGGAGLLERVEWILLGEEKVVETWRYARGSVARVNWPSAAPRPVL